VRRPLHYALGFHSCEEDVEQDESLLLLHLHKYDFQAYLCRHEVRASMQHAKEAVRNGWNLHYRVTGPQLLTQYMQTPDPVERIADWLVEACVV